MNLDFLTPPLLLPPSQIHVIRLNANRGSRVCGHTHTHTHCNFDAAVSETDDISPVCGPSALEACHLNLQRVKEHPLQLMH